MGNLIAFGFDRSWAANEVLKKLRTETALDDAFVVERALSGRYAIKRASNPGATDTASSSEGLWGTMVRLLFLNPSPNLAVPRGSSALFLDLKNAAQNGVLRAVKPYRARIIKTSLPREAEQRLKAEFAKAA